MIREFASANEEAVRLVLAHRTMLKAYIRFHIRDATLAEDTLADVTLAILDSWDRFDHSRPFEPWARGIARRIALTNLRNESRQPCLLDEDVLETVAQEIDEMGDESHLATRKEALQKCFHKL